MKKYCRQEICKKIPLPVEKMFALRTFFVFLPLIVFLKLMWRHFPDSEASTTTLVNCAGGQEVVSSASQLENLGLIPVITFLNGRHAVVFISNSTNCERDAKLPPKN